MNPPYTLAEAEKEGLQNLDVYRVYSTIAKLQESVLELKQAKKEINYLRFVLQDRGIHAFHCEIAPHVTRLCRCGIDAALPGATE